MTSEGIPLGAIPTPAQNYDYENESAFRDVVRDFMVSANAALQVTQTTSTGFKLMPASGRWFAPGLLSSASATVPIAVTTDRLYYIPFIPSDTVTMSAMGFDVGAGAGTLARCGIYDTTTDRLPGALLAETADMDPSTGGQKTASVSLELQSGQRYWAAFVFDAAPTIDGENIGAERRADLGDVGPSSSGDRPWGLIEALSGTWTALPDPAGSVATLTYLSGNMPIPWIQVA